MLLQLTVACLVIWETCCFITSDSFSRGWSVRMPGFATSAERRFVTARMMDSSTNKDDESDALARALAQSHPSTTSWYSNGLPFDCTECGKCCKTQGSVYMNPIEIRNACNHLNITSSQDFMDLYASQVLHSNNREEAWIRLKNNEEGACVFLNAENQCGIYAARPVQCSTYPFWPNIMQSRESWNDEVRKADGDTHDSIPYWTSEGGGCEGMQWISNNGDNDDDTPRKLVSPYEAYAQLMEYKRAAKSFPHTRATP